MSDKKYMHIDSIPGNSTDSAYKDWIPIYSIEFHATRPIEFKDFTPGNAPKNTYPALSEITITKPHCSALPAFFDCLNTLKKISVKIDTLHQKTTAGGNIMEQAAEATGGTACTRYEMDVAYVSDVKLMPNNIELITLTTSSLNISYNPDVKSGQIKSRSGYDFQMKKPIN